MRLCFELCFDLWLSHHSNVRVRTLAAIIVQVEDGLILLALVTIADRRVHHANLVDFLESRLFVHSLCHALLVGIEIDDDPSCVGFLKGPPK